MKRTVVYIYIVCVVFSLFFSFSAPVSAQDLPFNADKDKPLEITAQDTLEWHRKARQYVARGAVIAQQGDLTIKAEILTADYHEKSESSVDIWRLSAAEQVEILSNENKAYGSKAVYNIDKGLAIMTGDNLKMVSPDQIMTAENSFEYWVQERRLVAKGRAKVTRGDDTIQSDQMTAWFVQKDMQTNNNRKLKKAEANGHVVITTPTEVITGDYGEYNGKENAATLTGRVKITRGPNVLEGEKAIVNLNTHISKMFGGKGQEGRVRGIFYPDSEKNGSKEKSTQ